MVLSKIKTIPSWPIVQIMQKIIGGTFTPTADKLAVFADMKEALKNSQLDNWIINYNSQILEQKDKEIVLFCLWQNSLE